MNWDDLRVFLAVARSMTILSRNGIWGSGYCYIPT